MIGKIIIYVFICLEMDCNILMNVWVNVKIYFLLYFVLYLKEYSLLYGYWWEIFFLVFLIVKVMNMYVYVCEIWKFINICVYVY